MLKRSVPSKECFMRRFAILLLVLFGSSTIFAEQEPAKIKTMDDVLRVIEASSKPADALPALDFVLENVDRTPVMGLFLGAATAFANGRVEDAAFLFYAGQLRKHYDAQRFTPKGNGGDNPLFLFDAMSQNMGGEINPAIMREPKLFRAAMKRVEAWKPVAPSGYDPGWEYTAAKRDGDPLPEYEKNRREFLARMGDVVTVLNDAEYFVAFKTLQDFNFSSFEEQQKPERIKAKDAATAKMLAIETKMNVYGLVRLHQ
jgi:hypothetical protein